MLICLHNLKTAYEKLLNIQDKLEHEVEITKRKATEGKTREFDGKTITITVRNLFLDIAMVIEESRDMARFRSDYFVRARSSLHDIADRIENAVTAEDLYLAVSDIISALKPAMVDKIYDSTTFYDYSYDFKHKWEDYSAKEDSMEQAVVRKIATALPWTTRTVNVFEMFVRNEKIVAAFKGSNNDQRTNVDFYGLDSNENVQTSYVRSFFKRLIYGKLKGCVITNGCFDIVFCAPPISINKEIVGGQFVKRERELLVKTVDYLRPHGLLVFAIPYYRFAAEICAFLVKNYENLQVFCDGYSKLAYVTGTKRETSVPVAIVKTEEYLQLRNLPLHFYSKIPVLPDINSFNLQPQGFEVKRFRGSQLNEAELVEMYCSSKSTADFWKEQRAERLSESQAHPLLPFTIGQLGLILTSGCLDGIVDEGNGYCHAVKGRVVKKTETTENVDIDNHQIFTTNTITNRVEISTFLPDGTYKLLT